MKFLLVLIFISQFSHAYSRVSIDHDRSDCVDGWLSMDVIVMIDGERFSFDPSCRFSFSRSFETEKKVRCRIEAGMCSGFSPRNKIEVSCDGGGSDSVNVDCPERN